MTAKEAATVKRMAGNIAAGLIPQYADAVGDIDHDVLAEEAVELALNICGRIDALIDQPQPAKVEA